MTEFILAAGFSHLHNSDDNLNRLLDSTEAKGLTGVQTNDLDEDWNATEADLDEFGEIDFNAADFGNAFGAGDFQTFLVSF